MGYRTRSVVSADGTTIGYREFGRGPSVLLIHGGMQAAQNFTKLAEALAPAFTVCVPDRRGRGRSGPPGPGYGLAKECDDVEALLQTSGASRVFGLSSGALIALVAARDRPGIDKLAIYEPPLVVPGAPRPDAWGARCEQDLDRGRLAEAAVTIVQATGDDSILQHVPRVLLVPLARLAMRVDKRRVRAGDVPIADLIPTIRQDIRLVREAEAALESFASIRSDVLLLGGDRSARPLRRALDALAERLPHARRVELEGIGHLAADDTGRPSEVAALLHQFF